MVPMHFCAAPVRADRVSKKPAIPHIFDDRQFLELFFIRAIHCNAKRKALKNFKEHT
jgi:hypothetical protein